jgi:hypothetical protein
MEAKIVHTRDRTWDLSRSGEALASLSCEANVITATPYELGGEGRYRGLRWEREGKCDPASCGRGGWMESLVEKKRLEKIKCTCL